MYRRLLILLTVLALIWTWKTLVATTLAFATQTERVQEHLQDRVRAAVAEISVAGEPLYASETLRRFYTQRSYQPAWSDDTGSLPQVDGLLAALYGAEHEGLSLHYYHLVAIETAVAEIRQHQETSTPLDPARLAELDLLLSDAFITNGTQVTTGRLPGFVTDTTASLHQPAVDFVRLLQGALEGNRIAATLRSLLPSQAGYARLRQALARHRQIAIHGGWPLIPPGPTLQQGDRSDRVVTLRARLQASGDFLQPLRREEPFFDALLDDTDTVFDDELEQAVRAVQSRHGLEVDGIVGSATLAALNIPVVERIRQIALNLERWRRTKREFGQRHILVNIPGFTLDVMEQDQSAMRMRIIVGKSYWPTPIFQSTMTHLVLSPYWQVPPGIARREILPQVRQDPSYLTTHNMQVVENWGARARVIDASTIAWSEMTPKIFRYRFRQDPGPKNALGRVKFKFPNRFNVYLHDTPTQSLFAKPARAYSHGCIRIEKPVELATYLLRHDPKWTQERILGTMARGVERRVNLLQPIPVHMVYRTVWADEDGTVQFRPDIYGHDRQQATSLCDSTTTPCG